MPSVAYELVIFVITKLENGQSLAHAGIAADARYISIAWSSASRLDRLYADPKEWREFEARHKEHYPSTPLESTHIAVRLLVPNTRRSSVSVDDSGYSVSDAARDWRTPTTPRAR